MRVVNRAGSAPPETLAPKAPSAAAARAEQSRSFVFIVTSFVVVPVTVERRHESEMTASVHPAFIVSASR
jgi:hypothetical protein